MQIPSCYCCSSVPKFNHCNFRPKRIRDKRMLENCYSAPLWWCGVGVKVYLVSSFLVKAGSSSRHLGTGEWYKVYFGAPLWRGVGLKVFCVDTIFGKNVFFIKIFRDAKVLKDFFRTTSVVKYDSQSRFSSWFFRKNGSFQLLKMSDFILQNKPAYFLKTLISFSQPEIIHFYRFLYN